MNKTIHDLLSSDNKERIKIGKCIQDILNKNPEILIERDNEHFKEVRIIIIKTKDPITAKEVRNIINDLNQELIQIKVSEPHGINGNFQN